MKKVLVLQGGMSSEREISLLSGQTSADALHRSGYAVVSHDLTADLNAFIDCLNREKPDVVFNALHGRYGEDGCIQGLLNLMKVPYTHSGVLASAIGMSKAMTRQVVEPLGVTFPKGGAISREAFLKHEPMMPYVIKPGNDGSSVGVYIVRTPEDKQKALADWPADQDRIVEQYIPGREISVAVLDGKAIGIVEIVPKTGYYDFQNKYTAGATDHIVPAPIEKALEAQAKAWAEQAHQALGCRGVSRSDIRLDDVTQPDHPRLFFLEINTNPGMTPLSLVPDIARVCQGMSYEQLITHLVEEAVCDP